jgi:hypothetical protein
MPNMRDLIMVNKWSFELLTAVVASAAAVISALFAWRSASLASKTLAIAQKDQEDKLAHLSVYLIDALSNESKTKDKLVSFACTVTNKASQPQSIPNADLHLHTLSQNGEMTKIVLAPSQRSELNAQNLKALCVPINLSARETSSGWLTYEIPSRVSKTMSIDKYEIVFKSNVGDCVSIATHLLRKIQNET